MRSFKSVLRDARGPHSTPIDAGFDLSAYPFPCPLRRVPPRAGHLPVVLISAFGLGSFGIRQRQHGKNKAQGNNTCFQGALMSLFIEPNERAAYTRSFRYTPKVGCYKGREAASCWFGGYPLNVPLRYMLRIRPKSQRAHLCKLRFRAESGNRVQFNQARIPHRANELHQHIET